MNGKNYIEMKGWRKIIDLKISSKVFLILTIIAYFLKILFRFYTLSFRMQ